MIVIKDTIILIFILIAMDKKTPKLVEMKISDKWKRVLGSAMSSLPQDDSKPQSTSFLGRVVALGRKYEPKANILYNYRFNCKHLS